MQYRKFVRDCSLLAVFSAIGFVFIVSVWAADNSRQIETALRNHGESITKADEIRAKASEKARNEAISQLMKLASRAYTEKDRLSETNAWKAVLRLDRSHPKATQYFKDLGTLNKILVEIPADGSNSPDPLSRFIGKWQVTYAGGTTEVVDIRADGTVVFLPKERSQKYVLDKSRSEAALVTPNAEGACLNRYTLAGDKLLVEQWSPVDSYPKSPTSVFGRAVRVE